MTKEEIKAVLRACAEEKRFCTVRNLHESDERFLLPLRTEDEFYLAAVESELSLDGFLIDRLSCADLVIPAGDLSAALVQSLRLTETLRIPDMDLSAPDHIFAWLASSGCAVYLECVHPGRQDVGLFLCTVTDCTPETFDIRCFDTACHWDGGILTVPYTAVRRLAFGSGILRGYEAVLPPVPGRKPSFSKNNQK